MNYDKRIVKGCNVRLLSNKCQHIESLESMVGKIWEVQNVDFYPTDEDHFGCIKIDNWWVDFTQVEFVEENQFEQRKQAYKEGKLWWRFPNATGEYSKNWSLLSIDVPEQIIENRDFDTYGAEYSIGVNPPVEEAPKPVTNDNIRIEFYHKNTGKVYLPEESYNFYIGNDNFVYESDYFDNLHKVTFVGFRITVEK